MSAMTWIGSLELLIIFGVVLLPLLSAVPTYLLAKKKGYGQLAAAGSAAVTLVLAYFNLFLALVPLVFFALAPSKNHGGDTPVEPVTK